jgi:hypothetical protein
MMAGKRGATWMARLVVLATGVAVGFFLWRTYVDYVPHLYPLEFSRGQWVVAADESPQGYFRKEWYIPQPVQRAWMAVAATDSFILYVNGKVVDARAYAALKVSGIYDIGPYLQPGKNVIGVLVRRRSYPGAAMAVAEGAYVDDSGHEQMLATDPSWKVSAFEQRQGAGDIVWYSASFDDVSWSLVKTAERPGPAEIYPLAIHPFALIMPPQGKWIGHPDPQPATFAQTLTLSRRPEEAWMRIAAAGPYVLALNGVTVTGEEASRDTLSMQVESLRGDRIWRNPAETSTDVYQITPLVRSGLNRLTVTTERRAGAVPDLFVDGFVISHGEVLTFGSDTSWTDPFPSQASSGQSLRRAGAALLADRDLAGIRLPVKRPMRVVLPLSYAANQGGLLVLVVCLTAFLAYMVSKGTSRLLCDLQGSDRREATLQDALTYLPTLLLLGGVLLLSFDVRFNPALPYQGWVIGLGAGMAIVLKVALLLEVCTRKPGHTPLASASAMGALPRGQPLDVVLLSGLILVGAYLRLRGLDAQSLYHDEVHMVSFVKGLFEKGYPYKMIGPLEIPLATYELVPYPIALAATVLGFNDFALRLPAALFGIMIIPLIYVIGKQIFDPRVGLLAAAVYTFCPQALVWAKYLWHPQQTQFFALLTSYLFYRAIRPLPMSPVYLHLAAAAFIVTYLSWEGAGFLLPALGIGLLVVKGKDSSWLRDKHLWSAVGIVIVAITLQLTRRVLLQVPYLVVGTGLSDVSLPSPFFLDPMYAPTFYVKNFLWLESNVVLTLLLIGGVPILCKHAGTSYYAALLLAILLMMTNLLGRSTIRYVYYVQPFLILVACAVAWSLLDRAMRLGQASRLWGVWLLNKSIVVAMLSLVILGSSMFLQLYRLNDFAYPTGIHTRADSYYCDYRGSAQYVKSHYEPGDLIIVTMPEVLQYYTGISGDYFVQDYTKRQVLLDPIDDSTRYLERMTGIAVIRGDDDFRSVINMHRRIWIIAAPSGVFSFLSGPEVMEYVSKYGKVVYESYEAKIYLLES